MIADYYLIKNEELSNKDIYSIDGEGLYFYTGGWHLKGIYSLFLGFVFASSTIWNSNLMFYNLCMDNWCNCFLHNVLFVNKK